MRSAPFSWSLLAQWPLSELVSALSSSTVSLVGSDVVASALVRAMAQLMGVSVSDIGPLAVMLRASSMSMASST